MDRNREWEDLFALMTALNFGILFFYCAVCLVTTWRICDAFGAYSFLSTFRQIPRQPWRMPLLCGGLYVLLMAVSLGKNRRNLIRPVRMCVCVGEIALCAGITASVNFYYSGVALLVLADLVYYVQGSRNRILFTVTLVLLFTFGRYEIAYPYTSQIPFSAYLSYYNQTVRGWLTGIESVVVSLNTLLFMYGMILLFTGQKEENQRISRLNDQLHRANVQLRENAVELERLAEIRERNRLAREIHDTLGHTLTGIIMGLEAVLAISEAAPEEARRRVAVIVQTAREGLDDVRSSIKALRPDALETHTLEEALRSLFANFRLTTSVEIHFQQDAGPLLFASDEEHVLYRILQEGITNAVRHGHATEIFIHITRRDNLLTIHLRDNGLGCADWKEGFGLRHMEERLGLLGGSMTCGNRDEDTDDGEQGFYLIASLPVRGGETPEGRRESAENDPHTDGTRETAEPQRTGRERERANRRQANGRKEPADRTKGGAAHDTGVDRG